MSLLKALLLPPGCLILLGVLGLWLCRRRFRLGATLIAAAFVLLYVFSTPLFTGWALSSLSPPYQDPRTYPEAQAIVILGGGTYGFAPEYGSDMVSRLTLMRVRYGAKLYAITRKPILVSGGTVSPEMASEATLMRALLVDEFNVPVGWMEGRSRDTWSNALESHRILAPLGIRRVFLVTHAWHMPRARLAFEHAGFVVVPAPTQFHQVEDIGVQDLFPRASALLNSYYFFHELLGYVWYWLKIRF